RGGAEGAVAAAALDTAMPVARHTASTSRLEATASGSGPREGGRAVAGARATIIARALSLDGRAPLNIATARSSAEVVMMRPDR
ncbi:MAG: hypothetical protein WB785_14805, partial [Mycobacterium sp.]